MMKKYIKKVELATIVGTSAPYITKLEKNGIFNGCYEGDNLLRFEAIEAYINNIDFSRDSQRDANAAKRDNNIQYISKKDLAAAFAVSAPRISALEKAGVFENCYDENKLYRLASLKAYVEKISKKTIVTVPKDEDIEKLEPRTVEDIRKFYKGLIESATTPLQRASISKDEDIKIEKFLKNQELEKNLVDINIVKKEAFEMARRIRDSFISLPDRLSPQLRDKSQSEINQLLTVEINYILESLTNE